MSIPSLNPCTAAPNERRSRFAARTTPGSQERRSRRAFQFTVFSSWLAIAWTAFVGTVVAMVLGTIRFFYPNVLYEPQTTFKAGPPDQYEPESVVTRYKEAQHTWIVRHKSEEHGDILYALDATCTHLGCTPNWLEREQKFKCPCHGSGFYISGVNFEGPAPRPLERVAVSIGNDGQILVDKSKHFREELGQWADPASFITF